MAVPKREAEFLGLRNLDVFKEDTTFDSTYFRVLECPPILTQGKSSFLIGGSNRLKSGIDIKMELIKDDSDEILYLQPVLGHLEGDLRRVSIEVYEDVKPGPYTLYIVGEIDSTVENVPPEWQGAYNVRWSKQITVNGMGTNIQPIYFYKQPSISVSEIFTGFVEIPSSSATPIYLTGSGEPRQGLSSIPPVENVTVGGSGVSTYPTLDFANKAKLSIIEENKPLVKLSGKHGLIGAQGQQVQTMSPVPNDFVITVSGDSSVNSLYVGHDITINNPQVDTSKFTLQSYHSVPTVYSSSVMKVLNNTSFVPKDVFYVYDNRTSPPTLEPAPLDSTYPISASYLTLPTQTTSSINLLSFGDIQISDLKTFSGDVHKIKIYAKSEGSLGDFQLIYDAPVESYQVLQDKSEDTLLNNMGYFLDTSRLQNYWEMYQGEDGGESTTLNYDATYINDSMKISGSNKEYGDTLRVQNKTAVDFIAGNLYSFKAKVYGISKAKKDIDGNIISAASLEVLAKGDAFEKVETTSTNWGDVKLSVPDFPTGANQYDFGIVEGSFLADNTATGYLQFKVDSGEWYVSDISLKAATDTAFNPDYVRLKAPVPPLLQRPDRVRFLVEFYDVNNNIADSVVFTEPFDFQGANINIGGTDNILSGSMFIGNALAAGIEMAGVSSAFVRSMGYHGFSSGSGKGNNAGDGTYSGFLMWSGSVLTDSGDDYKGVGLELVGHSESYFRFRTDPSELDIRADSFFVGSENSQYISGSGSQIEISSSNFHVSSSGDVSMTGTITADAGNIGDWKIIDGKLSGSNATLDAVGAALYHTTLGPGSDTSAAFDQLRNEYYIDFTPSEGETATAGKYYVKFGPNFSVSESGVLFASGAVFEGTITASAGSIGGASIESRSLAYSPFWRISSSADQTDPASFISSSAFKVSAGGNITGSEVLFTGGTIGGFSINETQLYSGTDILLDSNNKRLSLADGSVFLDGDLSDGTIYVGRSVTANLSTPSGFGARFKGNGNFILVSGSGQYIRSVGDGLEFVSQNVNISGSSVKIYTPEFFLGGSGQYISGSNSNIEISSSKFYVDTDGNVTGSDVRFTGGRIAGWVISGNKLLSANNSMRINGHTSTPKITVHSHTFENEGVQLGYNSSGKIGFYAGDGANDYIHYHEDDGLDIKTAVFKLDTAQFDIDSSTASGKLSMGSTPPSAYNSGTGIYMDGTGKLLIGAHNGDRIQFDGTNFTVQVGSLELDANNIEISSTNASMSLGEGNILLDGANSRVKVGSSATKQITLQGHADYGYIATGKTSATSTTAGFWLANNDTDPEFAVGDATNYIKFDGGDLDIASEKLEISASTFQVSTAQASMSLGHNSTYPLGRLMMEGLGTPTFKMGPDVDVISMTTGSGIYMDGDGNFKFGDNDGQVKFQNGSFSITGSDVAIQVTDINVKANGFELSSQQASMSLGTNQQWKAYGGSANPYMSIGMGGSGSYGSDGLWLAYNDTIGKPRVSFVGSTGHFKFTGTDLDVKTGTLALAASNIQLSSAQASMSLGGVPGAAANILLDGGNSKIEVGSANKVTIQGGTTDNYMVMGSKTSFTHFDQSTQGIIIGMDSTVPKIEITKNSANYLSFDGTNFDIKLSQGFELDATNIEISSTNASMSLGGSNDIILDGANNKITVGSGNSITIQGGAADNYMVMGSKSSFTHEGSGTAGIIIGMDATNPQAEFVKSSTDYFIFDGGSGVDIKTTNFNLDANTGDLQISSTHKSMSLGDGKVKLQGASSPYMVLNSGSNAITLKTDGTDSFMVMGSKTDFDEYDKSTVGIILGMDTAVPKFEMAKSGDDYLRWDSTDGLDLRTTKMEVSASNVQISSTQASMSIGDPTSTGGAIVLQSQGTDKMLKFGNKATFDQDAIAGLIMGINGDTSNAPEFDYTVGTGNDQYVRMLTSGIFMKVPNFKLDTALLDIDSATSRIDIYDNSGGVDGSDLRVRIGEIDPTAGNQYGLVVYDGTGSGSADEIAHFGSDYNKIASWSISPTQISSENLILDSGGTMQTSDFASGVQGWRITSANNGEAEFEKVTIRGTLSTTVFEKESVNAVGGQLYVANSTIYTGSAQISATETTMSVANVGGFAAGEILSAKKVSDTGFQTEYLYVQSASRDVPSSDKNFMGKLYVVRGYSGSLPGTHDTGSLGDSAQSAQSYENGQVIVSTGKVGTGYVRINANPNDSTTPYIDIVERTGSAIYDISLKARLGDLSGLSSGLLYGNSSPGFGLFTENVFLQGGITATTGSFTGKVHIRTDASNQIIMGTDVDGGTNDGFYLNANNYWYTNDKFRIGDTNYYLKWDSSNIEIVPQKFELNAGSGDIQISSTQKSMSLGNGDIHFHSPNSTTSYMRLGSNTSKAIYITGSSTEGVIRSGKTSVTSNTAGFWLANTDGDQEFVVGDATDYIRYSGSAVDVQTRAFELDANNGDLQISSTQRSMSLNDGKIVLSGSTAPFIQIGNSANYSIKLQTDGTDQFMTMGSKTSFTHEGSGTGGILIGMDNDNPQAEFVSDDLQTYFIFDGDSGLDVKTTAFELAANTDDLQISSTQKSMSLASGKVLLDGGGNYGYIRVGGSVSLAGAIHISGSTATSIIRAGKSSYSDTTNAGFVLEKTATDSKFYVGDTSDGSFIKFDSDTGIEIGTQKFELAANTDDLQISSTQKSMSLAGGNVLLDGSQTAGYIRVGSNATTRDNIQLSGSNTLAVIKAGVSGSYADAVSSGDNGFILERNLTSTKFHLGNATEYIRFDGSDIDISADSLSITASNVNITAADGMEVDAPDFEISTAHKSMSLGYTTNTAYGVTMVGAGNSYISFGPKTSPNFQLYSAGATENYLKIGSQTFGGTQGGIILGEASSGVYKFEIYKDADEYFRFATDGGGLDIRTLSMSLETPGLKIHGYETLGASNYIALGSATSATAGEGYWADGGGSFRVGTATSGVASPSYMYFNSGDDSLTVKTDTLILDTAKIDIDSRHGGIIALGASSASLADLSGAGIFLSGSGEFNFEYDQNNYFRRKDTSVDIKSGQFGLKTSTLIISSSQNSGMITMGSTPNTSVDGTNSGTYMDGTGDFLSYGNAANYFRKDGTSLDIKAGTFDLDATTLIMDSALNHGVIRLGASGGPASVSASTAGIYLDGHGNLQAYGNATNYIRKSGTSLDIKADTFDLDATTIIMDSALNHGVIRLGASGGPANVSASTAGIYFDGHGNFQAYGGAADYIRKSGASLEVKVQNFALSGTSGTLSLGTLANASDTADTSTGFYVDSSGNFLAKSAATSGTGYIQASGGDVVIRAGNFGLGTATMVVSSSVNSGTIRMGSNGGPLTATAATQGIYMDGTGAFQVYGDSKNYLRINGGTVDILTDEITIATAGTNKVKLLADGTNTPTFAMGATLNTSISGTNKGVFMNGEGDFLLYGSATNYFKFDATAASIDIKSDTFDLDATGEGSGMILESATNKGKIALGSTPPSHASSSTGFYADGAGTMMVGNSSGNRMQYLADGTIYMKSSTFNLDATTLILDSAANNGKVQLGPSGGPGSPTGTSNAGAYLDGQGRFNFVGNANNYIRFNATGLEINTTYFDVNTAGEITATQGAIGGWYITSTAIQTTAPGAPKAAADMTLSNTGYIAMGSTTPQTFGSGGVQLGTYGSSAAKFLVANAADTAGHIKFDSADGQLHISSSTVLIGTSGSAVGGYQPAGAFVSMSAEGQMEISSSGVHIKPGGDAVFAGGDITFEQGGDIASTNYLIERSRLFGSGGDSPTVQASGTADTLTTGTGQAAKYSAEDGIVMITNTSANIWTLSRDVYMQDLTVNSGVYLETAGYRIFCRGTLTNNGWIRNDGHDGTSGTGNSAGAGGDGGHGGSLAAGTDGGNGGRGGYEAGGTHGGGGGGAGGTGGAILISARYIAGDGGIRVTGGDGGNGGTLQP